MITVDALPFNNGPYTAEGSTLRWAPARRAHKPVCRSVTVQKVTSQKSRYAVDMQGFPNAPIENVSISDCEFNGVEKGTVVANVNDFRLKNVRINGKLAESLD